MNGSTEMRPSRESLECVHTGRLRSQYRKLSILKWIVYIFLTSILKISNFPHHYCFSSEGAIHYIVLQWIWFIIILFSRFNISDVFYFNHKQNIAAGHEQRDLNHTWYSPVFTDWLSIIFKFINIVKTVCNIMLIPVAWCENDIRHSFSNVCEF